MDKFREAMEWWKAQDNGSAMFNGYNVIRNLAHKRLEEEMPEGQGIGSSDVNHTVYGIYCEWEAYKEYMEKKNEYADTFAWLVNEISEYA